MVFTAGLAIWAPLGFSIAIVGLFAAPHNWMEARYFLIRLPSRWRPLREYFLMSVGGAICLGVIFAALPWLAQVNEWDDRIFTTAWTVWSCAMIAWVAMLIQMRSRQKPRRDWTWTVPAALVFAGIAFYAPDLWGMVLVYLHPLIGFWILDQELRRRPEWRRAFHRCLFCLPAILALMWYALADAPPLGEVNENLLTLRIVEHAGAAVLPAISSHLLVATHAYLEVLHYLVWLVLIPRLSCRMSLVSLTDVPLARHSLARRRMLATLLAAGVLAVLFFWFGFSIDYVATRDLYFSLAIFHVLAEIPFLLRAL